MADSLDGLAKGLSSLMPQDDLDVKIYNAHNELDERRQRESRLFEAIGRQAWEQNPDAWPEGTQLEALRQDMAAAQEALDALKAEKEAEEAAKAAREAEEAARAAREAEEARHRCTGCGYRNADDARFCNQCGKTLPAGATAEPFCGGCGTKLVPGARFCAECGAKQD
ncbi:MAG: zinc ribbon domain-containing protein [Oscillospiraceae bacterium]|jgi:hypothetical protein|nr:zinc ribbon domain-containing protein [Oscillospiraceae bacterium]